MKALKTVVIVLCLILWPLNLYLVNTQSNFISYAIPVGLLAISYFLYKKYPHYYLIPVVFIGLFEKKLILLPIIFCFFELISKFSKKTLAFLVISLLILFINIPTYKGQTVFNKDYEGEQLVLRNIHLYPNAILARIFQNKPRIYLNKISYNFFALTDLNNYFFASHPAQTALDNQNLYKYPFVAMVFLLAGIYFIKDAPHKKFIIFSFVSSLITLIVLSNFDRDDFVLWLPIGLTIIHGINSLYTKHKKAFLFSSLALIIFAIPEFIRSYIK